MAKKALLVISFGTSYPETRKKTIEACEAKMREAVPDRDFFRAFTSNMIRAKLAKRDGLVIDHPKEALQKLVDLGYTDVAIQSLHVINGDEYEKITRELNEFKPKFERLTIGLPLLTHIEDYQKLIAALIKQSPKLSENERVVFMGHGATHYAFSAYAALDHMMTTQKLPYIVGAVESYPEIEKILPRLQSEHVKKVHLFPLMIVAGDHAINDMASDEEDSWKTQIEALGIQTECYLQGLGENEAVQEIFAEHLLDAMNREKELS